MNTLIVLFADKKSNFMFDKLFSSKSAFELSLEWAKRVEKTYGGSICIFTYPELEQKCQDFTKDFSSACVECCENWNVQLLFSKMAENAKKLNCNNILFAYSDQPFLDFAITQEIVDTHTRFCAEYTFADGYPSGFCPEMLDCGATAILSELAMQKEEGKSPISKTAVFDFIKSDINSFEVETVIADDDFKLFRLTFDCSEKITTIACQHLFEMGLEGKSVLEKSYLAAKNPAILKTVPAFYEIQISAASNVKSIYLPNEMQNTTWQDSTQNLFMKLEDFKKLIEKIENFSNSAVVSLCAWGEALLHPDFCSFVKTVLNHTKLSLVIETDGWNVTEDLCKKIKEFVEPLNDSARDFSRKIPLISWIVRTDAVSADVYGIVNGNSLGVEKALSAIALLTKYFPKNTYAQFVRMNENESELESFYRFWSDKNSPSNGNVIIQKFNSFCGTLEDKKSADLSPIERNPCWHLRRDMTILLDGSVPLCRQCICKNIQGNAFSQNLDDIWQKFDLELKNHLCGKYSSLCEKCDEYYTFNF